MLWFPYNIPWINNFSRRMLFRGNDLKQQLFESSYCYSNVGAKKWYSFSPVSFVFSIGTGNSESFFKLVIRYCVEISACIIQVPLSWNFLLSSQYQDQTNAWPLLTVLEMSKFLWILSSFNLFLFQSYIVSWQHVNTNFLLEQLF